MLSCFRAKNSMEESVGEVSERVSVVRDELLVGDMKRINCRGHTQDPCHCTRQNLRNEFSVLY